MALPANFNRLGKAKGRVESLEELGNAVEISHAHRGAPTVGAVGTEAKEVRPQLITLSVTVITFY